MHILKKSVKANHALLKGFYIILLKVFYFNYARHFTPGGSNLKKIIVQNIQNRLTCLFYALYFKIDGRLTNIKICPMILKIVYDFRRS